MVFDTASELGKMLGKQAREQDTTKQNINSDDPNAILQAVVSDKITVGVSYVATKKPLSPYSFIIDHPVLGEIDSPTLEIDGGYEEAKLTFTGGVLTFPLTFTGGDEILITGNF